MKIVIEADILETILLKKCIELGYASAILVPAAYSFDLSFLYAVAEDLDDIIQEAQKRDGLWGSTGDPNAPPRPKIVYHLERTEQ